MQRPLLLLSTLIFVACDDAVRSTGPVMGNAPSFAISDGANTGGGPANGDFFFLPPMVPDPSASLAYDAGAFDPDRAPRVEICRLTAVEPRVCAETIRTFESAAITVSTIDEQYQVNWHTDENPLALDQFYRIQVQLPRHSHDGVVQYHTLGYADVDPVNSGRELKNIGTGQVIGLVDGRTLPIKFRIERSPRCAVSDDCVEAIVSDQGGRVETETGYAIAEFPAGWLPEGFSEVEVVIQRVAIGVAPGQEPSCHGTAHVQYEGCYDFETFPDVGTFAAPAVISTCIEPDAAAYESQLQLAASDDGANFRILPPRVVTIECEGFQGTAAPIGFLGRIGERMLAFGERVGVALAPRMLYAVDKGRGGAIDGFSHGGWVLPMSVNRLAPDDEVSLAAAGTALPVSVMVTSAHESDATSGSPLAGIPVTFSLSAGGGTLAVALVVTNADGVASTTWTLGAPGSHLLTASVAGAALTIPITSVNAVPTTTLLQAPPLAIDGDRTTLTATVGGGTPQPGDVAQVSFFDDGVLLGTAAVNGDGVASLVVSQWALREHLLTASFAGTPTRAPSAAGPVTMQVVRRYGVASAFLAALGDVGTEQENFDAMEIFTPISTIIPGVLAVSSPFERLQVYSDNHLFGYDVEGSTRQTGLGRYELLLLASRNAIGFEIEAKDPNTGPMTIEVHTAAGVRSFSVQNVATESDPIFVSIIASQPIAKVVVIEGPEVTGTGNEETALDDFVVANAIGPF